MSDVLRVRVHGSVSTTRISFMLWLYVGLLSTPVQALEWENLWSSPEQRAKKSMQEKDYDKLIEQAPDAGWQGLGEYRKGDFAAAAKSFAEQREIAEQAGLDEQRNRASYNQANAHVQNAEYEQAINLYEDILSSNPEHDNALHNRDIAQQLFQLQQEQEQEQEQQQNSEGQESSDSQDEQSDDEQSSDQESKEGQEGQESDEGESSDESTDGQQSDQQANEQAGQGEAEEASSESEQQSAEEDALAAKAMQAEQLRAAEEAEARQVQATEEPATEAEPLTEREQANEQWLRQIPDDPAGLLERKIQNRHLTDFPKVKDSAKPW